MQTPMGDHILVIEDSAPIRRLVEICLRDLGPTIITAADGPSGLQSAVSNPPALIVLDIGLPGMHGWDVLAAVRSQPGGARIPVLILTAHANEEDRFRAGTDGADAFMTKPFDPSDLVALASSLLTAGVHTPTGRQTVPATHE
ncbi:MAG: response regulator [Actinobacteria bacterium]|nr:response regulator [Actinomycetota bacterium]